MSSRGRSIEELIAFALGVKEPKPKKSAIHYFLKYIKASKTDKEYTDSMIIYYVYYKWAKRRSQKKLSKAMFFKILREEEGYLQKQPKPRGFRAYHIISDKFNLSEDEMIEARKLQDKLTNNIYEKIKDQEA